MRRVLSLLVLATLLPACTSVKMPALPEISSPFRSDVADIPDYPKLSTAPVAPTDERAAAAWDAAARDLLAERTTIDIPPATDTATPAEVERDIAALKARVRAFRADDPS